MKKIFVLCFSVLCTNFLMSQTTVNAPSVIEVGINAQFSFVFLPSSNIPANATYYKLTSWFINSSDSNMNNSGYNYKNDNSQSLNSYGLGNPVSLSFPIRWDDNAPLLDDIININANIKFYDKDNNELLYTQYPSKYNVHISRIGIPIISNPTILNCSVDNVKFCADHYFDANSFVWTITNGTIVSGQGTSCITVTPFSTGSLSANCLAKRSTGLPSYTKSNNTYINRTERAIAFTTNPAQDYICKGSGLVCQVPNQSGMTSITWNAPNCTVSAESTVNGMRQVTIFPTSSASIGSFITVNTVANYIGGCTASAPSKTFKVFDSTAPPIPAGEIDFNDLADCNQQTAIPITFTPYVPFVNGTISIYPTVIAHPSKPRNFVFRVTYRNSCTGATSVKSWTLTTPAPCLPPATARLAKNSLVTPKITIEPNPTTGNVKVTLPATLSGNYQIFDNNILVQEAKFNSQTELQIELANKLKSGIYILKVFSGNNIFTDKILLNK
jgi:hypothetical protein